MYNIWYDFYTWSETFTSILFVSWFGVFSIGYVHTINQKEAWREEPTCTITSRLVMSYRTVTSYLPCVMVQQDVSSRNRPYIWSNIFYRFQLASQICFPQNSTQHTTNAKWWDIAFYFLFLEIKKTIFWVNTFFFNFMFWTMYKRTALQRNNKFILFFP